jgi:glycosyltransferase involved in cell wall biosynthesis
MIHVLYLHNSVDISGGERSLLALWGHLDRKRFKPFLLLPSSGAFSIEAEKIGVDVGILNVPSWRPWTWVALFKAFLMLRAYVLRNSIKIIHSYTPRNDLLASCLGRMIGVKVIWHGRNLVVDGERDISRMFFWFTDAVICNSYAVARRFKGKAGAAHKACVIHNGVDPSFFKPMDKKEAKDVLGLGGKIVIGAVANFSRRKGLDDLLDIASRLSSLLPQVVFVIVGGAYGEEGSAREVELKQRADSLGLSGRVVWAGFQQDVRPYLGAFDLLCHATSKEACSRAILEAMAMGICVVAYNDGGNPELIEDDVSGCLVPAADMDAMTDALRRLCDDDAHRSRLGLGARQWTLTLFDVSHNAQRTMMLYDRLIGNVQ